MPKKQTQSSLSPEEAIDALPSKDFRWFVNVPGWENFYVGVMFAIIGDTPRAIGLQLIPRDVPHSTLGQAWTTWYAKDGRPPADFGEPFVPLVLTSERVKRVPLQALADEAWDEFCADIEPLEAGFLADVAAQENKLLQAEAMKWEQAEEVHDIRAATTVADVARIYLSAAGRAPRDAVCDELGIGKRTADRYIQKAREQGLLPAKGPRAMREARARITQQVTTTKGQLNAKKGK